MATTKECNSLTSCVKHDGRKPGPLSPMAALVNAACCTGHAPMTSKTGNAVMTGGPHLPLQTDLKLHLYDELPEAYSNAHPAGRAATRRECLPR